MENTQNINPEYIKIAGEKIQRCVTYFGLQVVLSILLAGFSSLENVSSVLVWIFSIFILILGLISLFALYESGKYLIDSVSNPVKSVSNPENLEEESSDQSVEKEYYSNGNLKSVGSYNLDRKKHGVWKYYNKDGSLDFKEVYKDGDWVKNLGS